MNHQLISVFAWLLRPITTRVERVNRRQLAKIAAFDPGPIDRSTS